MRVTDLMMTNNAMQHMADAMEGLSRLQTEAATDKVITTPADNPSVAVTGLNLQSIIATNDSYTSTANTTSDWLDANELYLGQMVDIGTRALTLAQEGVSDTETLKERQTIANDLEGVLQNAVNAANGTHEGKFIFAGYFVNGGTGGVPPYQYTAGGGAVTLAPGITSTAGPVNQTIQRGQTIQINVDGNTVFQPLFQSIIAVRDDLNNPNFNTAQLTADISTLDQAVNGSNPLLPPSLSTMRSTNGDRTQQVNMALDRMTQTDTSLKNLLSQTEDANMADVITQLNSQQTVYQAVLSVGKNAVPQSLFDYLQ